MTAPAARSNSAAALEGGRANRRHKIFHAATQSRVCALVSSPRVCFFSPLRPPLPPTLSLLSCSGYAQMKKSADKIYAFDDSLSSREPKAAKQATLFPDRSLPPMANPPVSMQPPYTPPSLPFPAPSLVSRRPSPFRFRAPNPFSFTSLHACVRRLHAHQQRAL